MFTNDDQSGNATQNGDDANDTTDDSSAAAGTRELSNQVTFNSIKLTESSSCKKYLILYTYNTTF